MSCRNFIPSLAAQCLVFVRGACLLLFILHVGLGLAAAHTLPGIVQAEDYDPGGQGVGYFDNTPGNAGGQYRDDDVDISVDGEGNFYVSHIEAGEWLAYTVTADEDARFRVRFRHASDQPGPFMVRLSMDDITVDVQHLNGTGGPTAWANATSTIPFKVTAGTHTVRISFHKAGLHLDEFEFIEDTDPLPIYLDAAQSISNRVEDLLGRMTLEEKVGQTALVDRRFVYSAEGSEPFAHNISDIRTRFLGALFSGGGSAPTNNTPEGWTDMIDEFQGYARATRLGIPLLYATDAVHGHNNLFGATIFPHGVGLGASDDPDLVRRMAEATAVEIVASGVHWTFAPSVSVARNIFWGRAYEAFGEEPDLVRRLTEAAVIGFQGENLAAPTSVLACVKHFVGDGGTEWGTGVNGRIDQGDVIEPDTNRFRAIHLGPYEDAVAAGVRTIMASFSSWNGEKMHGHTNLLTEVLKEELGFTGFILSDWKAVDQLGPVTPAEYQNSIVKAVNAGIDMVMVPDRYITYVLQTRLATQAGDIPMARLDDAVRRILTVKFEKGLFERPYSDRSRLSLVGSPEHRELARECAARSLVLLKNENDLLPLPKNLTRIHVAGKNADNLGHQCGGWTYSWQGESTSDNIIGTTILEAIQNTVSSNTTITYSFDGTGAAGADVAIAVIGETPYAEFVGDSNNLRLPTFDLFTLSNLQSAGIPVVVVLVSGRPMIVEPELHTWDAFVAAWLPGSEGQGVADVLFGDVYPSGRLPVTWPVSNAQVPINIGDPVYEPLFAFQEGQSYRPPLHLTSAEEDLIFTWPAGASQFRLERTTSLLAPAAWTPVTSSLFLDGNHWVTTNAPSADAESFRLTWP